MRLTQKLLSFLHNPVFDKDPHAFLALRVQYITGNLTWQIYDGILTLTVSDGPGTSLTLPLSAYTVQSLALYIGTQPGFSIAYVDTSALAQLSALVLIDSTGNIDTSNGDHLYGYTNILWSYIDANANVLEQAEQAIPAALAEMDTTTADNEWLDLLGSYYAVPRNQGESDANYSPGIISGVLLPSGNNVGMAIALESRFQGSSVACPDAVTNQGSLLLRDGTIFFNSAFLHNSNVGTISNGFFDVIFAYNFNGPISPTQYVPLILTAVNKYRDAGTYVRQLVIKNGTSASVLVQSFNIGPILVVIYDQDVGQQDQFVWSDEEPDESDRLMYLDCDGVVSQVSPNPVEDGWDWSSEEPDDHEWMHFVDTQIVGASNAPNPVEDAYIWTDEESDEDDRLAVFNADAIGFDSVPNSQPDDWDWSVEEPDEDDRLAVLNSDPVGLDAVSALGDAIDTAAFEDEPDDFFADHFTNYSASPMAPDDPWLWDEEPALIIVPDGYQNR